MRGDRPHKYPSAVDNDIDSDSFCYSSYSAPATDKQNPIFITTATALEASGHVRGSDSNHMSSSNFTLLTSTCSSPAVWRTSTRTYDQPAFSKKSKAVSPPRNKLPTQQFSATIQATRHRWSYSWPSVLSPTSRPPAIVEPASDILQRADSIHHYIHDENVNFIENRAALTTNLCSISGSGLFWEPTSIIPSVSTLRLKDTGYNTSYPNDAKPLSERNGRLTHLESVRSNDGYSHKKEGVISVGQSHRNFKTTATTRHYYRRNPQDLTPEARQQRPSDQQNRRMVARVPETSEASASLRTTPGVNNHGGYTHNTDRYARRHRAKYAERSRWFPGNNRYQRHQLQRPSPHHPGLPPLHSQDDASTSALFVRYSHSYSRRATGRTFT